MSVNIFTLLSALEVTLFLPGCTILSQDARLITQVLTQTIPTRNKNNEHKLLCLFVTKTGAADNLSFA